MNPALAAAHYNMGLVLRRYNRRAEARAEFETTLRLDPKNYKAHGNLGFIFFEESDLAAAQNHFETAIRLNPDEPLLREGLERVLRAGGR